MEWTDPWLVPDRQEKVRDTCIFTWHLDALKVSLVDLNSFIPATEAKKLQQSTSVALRQKRTLSRVLLRATLGAWVGGAPKELTFIHGPYGKPYLQGGPAFNSSHSGPYFVMAIRPSGEVGVDIEMVRSTPDLTTIARSYFSPDEAAEIGADPTDATEAFFRTWVRKEALLKGLGAGLSIALHSFRVSSRVAPVGTNVLIGSRTPAFEASAWTVSPLSAPPGAQAALAWNDPDGYLDASNPEARGP